MTRRAIYMSNGLGPDAAIEKGLAQAGCEVIRTHTVAETLEQLKLKTAKAGGSASPDDTQPSFPVVLVAEIQAGAIPLLTLMREQGAAAPPTLVFDRDGSDIRVAIKALQLGVQDYLLATDPDVTRELCACVMAERGETSHPGATHGMLNGFSKSANNSYLHLSANPNDFEWDPIGHVVRVGTDNLRLSPIEGRIFDLLYANRGQVVTVKDFVTHALKKPALKAEVGARQLRPHLMRLRRKLSRYPLVSSRIVNTRGAGYMLV
jgi:DNA-binding response OmpR family regulator